MNLMKESFIVKGSLDFSFAFCYLFPNFGYFPVTLFNSFVITASLSLVMTLDSMKLLLSNFILGPLGMTFWWRHWRFSKCHHRLLFKVSKISPPPGYMNSTPFGSKSVKSYLSTVKGWRSSKDWDKNVYLWKKPIWYSRITPWTSFMYVIKSACSLWNLTLCM